MTISLVGKRMYRVRSYTKVHAFHHTRCEVEEIRCSRDRPPGQVPRSVANDVFRTGLLIHIATRLLKRKLYMEIRRSLASLEAADLQYSPFCRDYIVSYLARVSNTNVEITDFRCLSLLSRQCNQQSISTCTCMHLLSAVNHVHRLEDIYKPPVSPPNSFP